MIDMSENAKVSNVWGIILELIDLVSSHHFFLFSI